MRRPILRAVARVGFLAPVSLGLGDYMCRNGHQSIGASVIVYSLGWGFLWLLTVMSI
jgi:hypothetical protein